MVEFATANPRHQGETQVTQVDSGLVYTGKCKIIHILFYRTATGTLEIHDALGATNVKGILTSNGNYPFPEKGFVCETGLYVNKTGIGTHTLTIWYEPIED